MSTSFSSLSQLRALKRAELQSLCKANSLKANGKNEDLIKSLAQHFEIIESQTPTTGNDKSSKATASAANLQVYPSVLAPYGTEESERLERSRGAADENAGASPGAEALAIDPRIQALLDSLVADVAFLKDGLAASLTKNADLQLEAVEVETHVRNAIRTDIDKLVLGLADCVEHKVEPLEKEVQDFKTDLTAQLLDLQQQIHVGEQERTRLCEQVDKLAAKVVELETIQAQTKDEMRSRMVEEQARSLSVEGGLNERIKKLELENEELRTQRNTEEEEPRRIAQEEGAAQPGGPSTLALASPTGSDAPPTRSLVSFDSPAGSPAPQTQSTPVRASFAPVSSHKATPFRFGPISSSSTTAPASVSAIPPHVVASVSRRSPRSPRTSTISSVVQPESPAAPIPNASLGKRSRDSDASNLSVGLETVASPVRSSQPQAASLSGFFSAPTSTRKEDGHSRKKLRMSVHGDDDTFDHSTIDKVAIANDQEEEDEDQDPENENSSDSVRDYLMPTKTGDSPSTAPPPPGVSTSDPSFFSAPVSPVCSTPGRRSVGQVNENHRPSTSTLPRKSLPVSNLPFPLVSPFAKKTLPTSSFGTPATTALGNLSNQHFTTLLKSTSKSARKASPSKQRTLPPRTPPASRTLFGTERFPFSDGFDEESKFDDDFETAEEDNTETETNWSRFGGGAFSRV